MSSRTSRRVLMSSSRGLRRLCSPTCRLYKPHQLCVGHFVTLTIPRRPPARPASCARPVSALRAARCAYLSTRFSVRRRRPASDSRVDSSCGIGQDARPLEEDRGWLPDASSGHSGSGRHDGDRRRRDRPHHELHRRDRPPGRRRGVRPPRRALPQAEGDRVARQGNATVAAAVPAHASTSPATAPAGRRRSTSTARSSTRRCRSKGPASALKNSVLPHEVTHTVFAHHFRQPVPRWADEGGSVYSEDDDRARPARQAVQDHPQRRPRHPAQGSVPPEGLPARRDDPVRPGLLGDEVPGGVGGPADVPELRRDRHAAGLGRGVPGVLRHPQRRRAGAEVDRPPEGGRRGSIVRRCPAVRVRPRRAPIASSWSLIAHRRPGRLSIRRPRPAGWPRPSGDRDRFGGDIGWNRPRARLADPVPADDTPRPGSRTSGTSSRPPVHAVGILAPARARSRTVRRTGSVTPTGGRRAPTRLSACSGR